MPSPPIPYHYFKALDAEEKEFVENVSSIIQDRLREEFGEVDHMDRVLARRVAIKLHIVSKASDYLENESGLVQTIRRGNSSRETTAPLLEEIRKYDSSIFADLKKLGVLGDPESQKASAVENWRTFIEGADSD